MKDYKRSSKINAVLETLAKAILRKEKTVIYTQFLGMIPILELEFASLKLKFIENQRFYEYGRKGI